MNARPARRDLQDALVAAGTAHHEYELNFLGGKRDDQWPGWYAAYVLGRLGDFTSPTSLARHLAGAPASENWAASAAEHVLIQLGG